MTYYTNLGNGNQATSARSRSEWVSDTSQLRAAVRTTDKLATAHALDVALQTIRDLHRAEFAPARPPAAPAPPAVPVAAIRARHRNDARAATTMFSRKRREALAEAERRTQIEVEAVRAHYQQARLGWQRLIDQQWAALNANDPDTVLAVLAEAFEDNQATAAAVGVHGAEITLVVVVPTESAIPERRPTTTAAGNLSLKKLTKSEVASLYLTLVCGHVLVTVKEAFAVAPSLASARIVAIRSTLPDAVGRSEPEVVLAARLERTRLQRVAWSSDDSSQILNKAASEQIIAQKGVTKQLIPIDLAQEPELAALMNAIHFEDLA